MTETQDPNTLPKKLLKEVHKKLPQGLPKTNQRILQKLLC